jgi:hypothetical protein
LSTNWLSWSFSAIDFDWEFFLFYPEVIKILLQAWKLTI